MAIACASRLLLPALSLVCTTPVPRPQTADAAATPLAPAGSLNDVLAHRDAVLVVEKHAGIERFVAAIRKQFFPRGRSLDGEAALHGNLAGTSIVFYGTPDNPWLKAHAARLPFQLGKHSIDLAGRHFEGDHLRLICAIKNPHDVSHTAALYIALDPADVININSVFHGPSGWVVADGPRVLAAGDFAAPPLTTELMQADLDTLENTVRDVHPAAAAELPPAFATALDAARDAITEPMPRDRFWRIAAAALGTLHDAHSSLAPPTSGELLDLPLEWLAEGLVVRSATAVLRAGDRVLAIGERDPDALLFAAHGGAGRERRLGARAANTCCPTSACCACSTWPPQRRCRCISSAPARR
ncbi:MAG: hypothetical protein U1E76_25530 [Planctomycetota bacterium]